MDMVKEQLKNMPDQRVFTVPEGIVKIGYRCFSNTNVEEVILPSSVRELECEAFRWCENLKTIILPEGLETIGVSSFRETGIKEIVIPKSVKRIEAMAFSGYVDDNKQHRVLEKMVLQEGLEYIGE